MTPILSIVIPTHNRAQYAISSIKSILSFENEPIEVIVTDTSDNNDLEGYVSNINDSRLIYKHIQESLSMTENYNLAMSLASGEFICLIGDDDTITEDAITAAKWAKNHAIKIVSPLVVANYAWPDFKHRFLGMAHAGNLYIRKKFSGYRLRNSSQDLKKALSRSVLGTEDLPKIYHSIVAKELLDKIKEKSGAYFHGVSPDVSGAVGLSLVSETYLEIDYPLTIPGAAGKSNSGRSAMNKHKGTLADDTHTSRFKNLNWPELLPQFTSVETVWAQAAYSTLEAFKRKDLLEEYNYINLYAICSLKHRDHFADIKKSIKCFINQSKYGKFKFAYNYRKYFLLEILKLLKRYSIRLLTPSASGNKNSIKNLQNIYEAQLKLNEYLNQKNIKIEIFLKDIK